MEFKPNWIKIVVSIVSGAFLGMIIKVLIEAKLNYCPPGAECLLILRTAGPAYLFILSGIVLLYVIWSLVQSRSKK